MIISNRYRDGGNFLKWNYFISVRKTIEALGMKFETFNDMVISYANTYKRAKNNALCQWKACVILTYEVGNNINVFV